MFKEVNPVNYLDIARALALDTKPQAQRTAADRAYYAAFLFARDALAAKGYITPYYATKDHEFVTQSLRKHVGNIGNDENRMRTQRNNVTYETGPLGSPSLTWMIETAETIIKLVDDLPPKSTSESSR